VLKRRNHSRTRTIARGTRSVARKDGISQSPEKKKQRVTRSRSTKRSSSNKENAGNNNAGTPPWKAAKDRENKFSPRLTRSAKKKKLQNLSDEQPKEGLLVFSPPNQAENARRQKMEFEKKLQKRADRIENNRKNGNLLVFSKDFECLTQLPAQSTDDNNLEEGSTETVKQQSEYESPNASNDQSISSICIDEQGRKRDSGDFSGLTKSTSQGEHSKEMISYIKGLDQKFELLDRRLSEFRPAQPVVEQPISQITEEQMEEKVTEIKELSQSKSKLERENKNLGKKLDSLKSDLLVEREKLVSSGAEFQQMKSLNESLKLDLNKHKEKNAYLSEEVLPKTEKELEKSLEELKKRQGVINQTSSKLREYETKMKKLKSENKRLAKEIQEEKSNYQTLSEDSRVSHQEQNLENEKKEAMIKEIQQSLALTKSELAKERSRNNEMVIELQSALLQVKNTMMEKENIEKEFADFKNDIVSKSKENNAAIQMVEEEKDFLQKRLRETENKLKFVTEEKNDALMRLGTSDEREDELFDRLRESDRVRKELHSRVMVLIGNIRVFVRVRPPIPSELEASSSKNTEQIFKFSSGSGSLDENKSSKYGCDDPTKNILKLIEPKQDRGGLRPRQKKYSFGFDNVFDPSKSQEDVWEATEPLVQCAIDGFNVTLFAYGQTGSGKTFTMLGDGESLDNQGIIFRSIRKLFDAKAKIEELSKGEKAVTMTVELLEIYNEQVRDLLAPKAAGGRGKETSLKVFGNKAVGSIQQSVHDESSVFAILKKAQQRRTVKATQSNATSSRSHLLFTIEYTITAKDGSTQVGKLNVCDLAGSERLSKSGAHLVGGSLLKESININLSLSNLSNVIEKLQAGDKNVPFRDSKLTSLLQNSLEGNSKTLCIICCNPLQSHFSETLGSLRFAAKINKVDLKSLQNFSA